MLLNEAIKRLRPNADYVIYGNTLDGLEFVNPTTTLKPTQAEIDATIAEIKAEQEAAKIKTTADKAALLTKLGITEDEAKLLLS
jgi:hypothetical protein